MALMLEKTYDALVAAGAPDDKARAAAAELAGYDSSIADVRSDMKLVKWMVGANTGLLLIAIGKLFF